MKYFIDLLESGEITKEKKTPYGITLIITNELVVAVDSHFRDKIRESRYAKESDTKRDRSVDKG